MFYIAPAEQPTDRYAAGDPTINTYDTLREARADAANLAATVGGEWVVVETGTTGAGWLSTYAVVPS